MYYQQQLQQERRENEAQAFEQFKNSFKNDFPIKYVALHCTFMAILNVTLISTQITQIICESYMANLSIGIWSGVTNIITTYTAFILIYKQKLSLLSVALVFHMISFVVTLVGSILQILPISQYNKSPGVFIELNVIQLFIGMVVTSMCMFFFVFMQCRGLCLLKK